MQDSDIHSNAAGLSLRDTADVVVDVWRIRRRAHRDEASHAVRIACETALDRLTDLGFRLEEMLGEPYDENLRVRVLHQEGGPRNLRISECLAPAVYFQNELVRTAEIIIQGENEDGTADS
jgi:hypothetical protein